MRNICKVRLDDGHVEMIDEETLNVAQAETVIASGFESYHGGESFQSGLGLGQMMAGARELSKHLIKVVIPALEKEKAAIDAEISAFESRMAA